jgi:two-component system, response regulator FlrC
MSNAPRRVLIVDDEVGILRMFRTALVNAGFAIEEAVSGRLALERLSRESFDVVVSDVNMPGMDGHELLGRVRALYPDLPLILMTGRPSSESSNKAAELGAAQYLIKPVFPAALKQAVEHALQGSANRTVPRADPIRPVDCVCKSCGRTGAGACIDGGWRRYPLGWFARTTGELACSEACATVLRAAS